METVEPLGEKVVRSSELALSYSRLRGSGGACAQNGTGWFRREAPAVAVCAASETPRKILVAEDDLLNRMLIVRLLEKLGHQVTVAKNGREAVELAAAESFDLVFMDMLMPELSGLEATRAIRRLECSTLTHLPIIALTASGDPEDRELCLAAGMDDYASKPLSTQELTAVIGRFTTAG